MVYRNATLKEILKNKEVRLIDSLYGYLPETRYAEKIYKFRMINGLTQTIFARKAKVHCYTLRDWENGTKIPSQVNIKNIYDAFGLDLSDLK